MSKVSSAMASLLGLLAILAVLLVSSGTVAGDVVPIFQDTFDVEVGAYGSFMSVFNNRVNSTASYRIDGHPVLGEQNVKGTPAFWFHVHLKDNSGVVTLAVRSDNLYISGFRNKYGEWVSFLSEEKSIPGSKPLSFAGGYLVREEVGLYWAGTRPDLHLQAPLAFYVLAVSEAERFLPIRAAVSEAWNKANPQTIPLPTLNLVVHWAEISCALLAWDRYGRTEKVWSNNDEAKRIREKPLGITTPEEALSKTNPLIRGKRCSWTGKA